MQLWRGGWEHVCRLDSEKWRISLDRTTVVMMMIIIIMAYTAIALTTQLFKWQQIVDQSLVDLTGCGLCGPVYFASFSVRLSSEFPINQG